MGKLNGKCNSHRKILQNHVGKSFEEIITRNYTKKLHTEMVRGYNIVEKSHG